MWEAILRTTGERSAITQVFIVGNLEAGLAGEAVVARCLLGPPAKRRRPLETHDLREELHTVVLPPGAWSINRSIEEVRARGAEVRPAEDIGVRLAYESPLTDNEDLFGYRWTFSMIWSF